MANKKISKHPKSQIINFKDSLGNVVKILSCVSQKGEYRLLEADMHSHPAWTKNSKNSISTGSMETLEKKFAGFKDL